MSYELDMPTPARIEAYFSAVEAVADLLNWLELRGPTALPPSPVEVLQALAAMHRTNREGASIDGFLIKGDVKISLPDADAYWDRVAGAEWPAEHDEQPKRPARSRR